MPRKALFVLAGTLAVFLAIVFLGHLAIRIGELPLIIIVFGVLAMMVLDFVDTTRTNLRANDAAGKANGQPNGPSGN